MEQLNVQQQFHTILRTHIYTIKLQISTFIPFYKCHLDMVRITDKF